MSELQATSLQLNCSSSSKLPCLPLGGDADHEVNHQAPPHKGWRPSYAFPCSHEGIVICIAPERDLTNPVFILQDPVF